MSPFTGEYNSRDLTQREGVRRCNPFNNDLAYSGDVGGGYDVVLRRLRQIAADNTGSRFASKQFTKEIEVEYLGGVARERLLRSLLQD